MSNSIFCLCVQCQLKVEAPFPEKCPHCGFGLDHLEGKNLSDFQKQKKEKHDDLLFGRKIQLQGSDYNASFDSYGDANLTDLLRFTLSYGHPAKLPSKGGRHQNDIVLAFIPEIVGSGISIYDLGYDPVPCSGIAVISPASQEYGHGFPVLDDWVHQTFKNEKGHCVSCGESTSFGHSLCQKCYLEKGSDWRKFL